MASGSYRNTEKETVQLNLGLGSKIPQRTNATRDLELEPETTVELSEDRSTSALPKLRSKTSALQTRPRRPVVVNAVEPHPLARHLPWLKPFVITMVIVVVGLVVLISAGLYQRPGTSGSLVLSPTSNGQVFSIQVGGTYGVINSWNNTNGPIKQKVPIPAHLGPYGVLGKPTLNAAFIDRVLTAYNSPAAGKGQALYNDGVKYGIDPAFALAFFLHESTFGKFGWAKTNLSLGNIRCVPEYPCNGGYSQYTSWEQGFEAWYKLIRNLYVAQWGLVTVDTIIPTYAPAADHNNEAAYIQSLKHSLDTWHGGQLMVS